MCSSVTDPFSIYIKLMFTGIDSVPTCSGISSLLRMKLLHSKLFRKVFKQIKMSTYEHFRHFETNFSCVSSFLSKICFCTFFKPVIFSLLEKYKRCFQFLSNVWDIFAFGSHNQPLPWLFIALSTNVWQNNNNMRMVSTTLSDLTILETILKRNCAP